MIIWWNKVWGKVMWHLGLSSSPEMHLYLHFIGGCRLKVGSAQKLHGFSLAVGISTSTINLTSRCFLVITESKALDFAYLSAI